jgi:hypothetical protein
VTKYLHQLSAFLFYLLGSAFFVAYILYRNGLGGAFPIRLLTEADLPLLACAMLYGGLSVIRSVDEEGSSKGLRWAIGAPLFVIFLVFVVFNFWNRIGA